MVLLHINAVLPELREQPQEMVGTVAQRHGTLAHQPLAVVVVDKHQQLPLLLEERRVLVLHSTAARVLLAALIRQVLRCAVVAVAGQAE